MKWEPPVVVNPSFEKSYNAAVKHVKETKSNYGSQYWVNLIDRKKQQLRIGDAFTHLFNELNDKQLHYVWFYVSFPTDSTAFALQQNRHP